MQMLARLEIGLYNDGRNVNEQNHYENEQAGCSKR